MAYCTVADVQGRAGALLDVLTANPTSAEVDTFIADVGSVVEGYLAGFGATVPVTDAEALRVIRDTVISGVLVRALSARFSQATEAPTALVDARAEWSAASKLLAAGKHPAQLILREAGASEPSGGSFMADEAGDYIPAPLDPRRVVKDPETGLLYQGGANSNVDPIIYQGMKL